jgi:hypothetical protein
MQDEESHNKSPATRVRKFAGIIANHTQAEPCKHACPGIHFHADVIPPLTSATIMTSPGHLGIPQRKTKPLAPLINQPSQMIFFERYQLLAHFTIENACCLYAILSVGEFAFGQFCICGRCVEKFATRVLVDR